MKLSDKEWRVLNALWVAPEGLALGGRGGRSASGYGLEPQHGADLPHPHGGQGPGGHPQGGLPPPLPGGGEPEDCAAAERRGLLERAYQGSAAGWWPPF